LKWFSQRKGLKKIRTEIQVESMDKALRNRLWNVFFPLYLDGIGRYNDWRYNGVQTFVLRFWDEYRKLPTTSAPQGPKEISSEIAEYFFNCEWGEVYDFLECVVAYFPNEEYNKRFITACNTILESEMSGYRFLGDKITEVTAEEELQEIEQALENPYAPVRAHIEEALKLMSDRKSPNYRNSIKESISAVEATCNLLAGKKVTLGQCLKDVKEKIGLHGALEKAFSSLYGYTSEAEGIRHALMDEPTLSFEDAKFMLVSCSAFVNYLISKASKAGIKMR
jgi:hypothetical protein